MRWVVILLLIWVCGSLEVYGQAIAWEKQMGWRYPDELLDVVVVEGSSDVVACGTSYLFGLDDAGQIHHNAVTLVYISSDGDTLWHKPLPFYGGDARLCAGDSQSFFMVATAEFTPPALHAGYLALFKIGYDGRMLWQRSIPNTTKGTRASKVIRATNGDIIVAGWRGASNSPTNLYDMFVMRLDTSGQVHFNQGYNESRYTFGNYIEETPDGTFLA